MSVKQKIRLFLVDHFSTVDSVDGFSDDDNYFELRFVNSLFAMTLVNFVEKTFDIQVKNSELDINNFCTVTNLASFIEHKQLTGVSND